MDFYMITASLLKELNKKIKEETQSCCDMWQSIFANKQTVFLQCLGKLCFIWNVYFQCFIIEKITLCFVLSLYDNNRLIFTIYFYIIWLVLHSWNLFFYTSCRKIFFSIRDQIINFHAALWGRFLRWRRVTMNE